MWNKLTFVASLLLFNTSEIVACSCMGSESIKKAFKRSDIVFVGEAISNQPFDVSQEPLGDGYIDIYYHNEIIFKVHEWFKGATSATQIIYSGIGGGDCGFYFQEGEQYIVYATNEGVYMELGFSKMQTNICDRTSKLQDQSEDLAQLRKLHKPSKIKSHDYDHFEEPTFQMEDSTTSFIFPFTKENSNEPDFRKDLRSDSVFCRLIWNQPFYEHAILFRIKGLRNNFELTVKQVIENNRDGRVIFVTKQLSFKSDELKNILEEIIQNAFYSQPRIQTGIISNHPLLYSIELTTQEGGNHFTKWMGSIEVYDQLILFLMNFGYQNELFEDLY